MRLSLEAAPKGPLQQVLFFDLRKQGVNLFTRGFSQISSNYNLLNLTMLGSLVYISLLAMRNVNLN